MNNFKSLLSAVLMMTAVATLVSCSDDDLENRLDKVESALGADEPLKVDFQTTNANNEEVTKKTSFILKSTDNDYDGIWIYPDGSYYVYIERFADVDWNEGAWISFYYNPTTKEVSDASAGVYFYDQYGSNRNVRFYEDTDGNALEIKVNGLNEETGKINLEISASSETSYQNNIFSEKTMTMSLNFKGKLRRYTAQAG